MHDPEHDPSYANFSKELVEARRAMRKELLNNPDNIKLRDLYYRALMLTEHEARRLTLVSVVAPEAPPAPRYAEAPAVIDSGQFIGRS